ncbi:MAG: type II toxin-antitoxin system HicB family antitoxin [Oscillospiraceae bacterium]|nr:type II toxin-antitoxin system HicB family antitoxin [Oscillospiraceae bacterium]
MKLIYPACFYPDDEEKNFYTVIFPDLPGAVTEGRTLATAIEMAVDCACGWILSAIEDNEIIPEPSPADAIKPNEYENGFVNFILLDIDAYAEKYGSKAVRKNCTIPAWLNTAAENANLNFSQILQNALLEKLHLN